MTRLQRLFALGIVLWWGLYFTVTRHAPPPVSAYFAFEDAFPLADLLWLTPLLLLAARHNARRTPQAPVWTAASGGTLVFLGLLDLTFNLQHGLYTHTLAEGLLNAGVNLACIGFGLYSLAYALRSLRRAADPHER